MEFDLDRSIAVLERTPEVLTAWLQNLPETWTHCNEGEDTWSPHDIIGHLIHGEETDWIPRAKIILGNNDPEEFEPFDRFAQFEISKGKSLEQLLDIFAKLRNGNISILKSFNLTPKQLNAGGTHPELGKITLKELLATWTVHDLSHIAQISRIMGKQYKDQVGPWGDYIPFLDS